MIAALGALLLFAQAGEPATVGMPRRMEGVVLPGSELAAKPLTDARAPIVLRVERVAKHGTAHRYDLVYHGLEPGRFDLRDWLQRLDGSSMADLPEMPVEIRPAYEGPMKPVSDAPPEVGGMSAWYRGALIAAGVAWVAGFAALVATRRRRKDEALAEAPPPTLAEQLAVFVNKAARETLTRDEQAELERLLLSYWRKREGLEGLEVADAIRELRTREVPGALLRTVEEWLHRPGPRKDVDIAALLGPYGGRA